MPLGLLGLILIVIGWGMQFLSSFHGSKKMHSAFPVLYGAGVLGLVVESINAGGFGVSTWLNILVLLLIVLILVRTHH